MGVLRAISVFTVFDCHVVLWLASGDVSLQDFEAKTLVNLVNGTGNLLP